MRFQDREIEIIQGDQRTVLRKVDEYAEREKSHPFITSSIKKYNLDGSRQSLKRIFDAIFRIVYFFPDPPKKQYIKTVNRTLKDQRGNCVDYSVMFSAFLRALGVPHRISIVEYPDQKLPGISHIYVQTMQGITLDAVIGQDQEGYEINKPHRFGYFDYEVLPVKQRIDKRVLWR
jgi:transglutaminase-like putative cysteine protease